MSILPYLTYDVSVYTCSQESMAMQIKSEYFFIRDVQFGNIVSKQGLKMETWLRSQDVVEQIRNSISRNSLVILWVDAFHITYRKDTYHAIHWPHTLLIYGFDDGNSMFQVIDHDRRENLSYEKKTISYEEIRLSYQAYLEDFLFTENEPASFYEFRKGSGTENIISSQECLRIYKESLQDNKKILRQSLDVLRMFCNTAPYEITAAVQQPKRLESLIKGFTSVILAKDLEVYRTNLLFPEMNGVLLLQRDIAKSWLLARSRLAKVLFTNQWKQETLDFVLQKIKDAFDMEYQNYKLFFSNFK